MRRLDRLWPGEVIQVALSKVRGCTDTCQTQPITLMPRQKTRHSGIFCSAPIPIMLFIQAKTIYRLKFTMPVTGVVQVYYLALNDEGACITRACAAC